MKQVTQVDIGEECVETFPCSHYCTITFDDGSVSEVELDGDELISNQYWPFLKNDDKNHFEDMLHDDDFDSTDSKYTLFRQYWSN